MCGKIVYDYSVIDKIRGKLTAKHYRIELWDEKKDQTRIRKEIYICADCFEQDAAPSYIKEFDYAQDIAFATGSMNLDHLSKPVLAPTFQMSPVTPKPMTPPKSQIFYLDSGPKDPIKKIELIQEMLKTFGEEKK
jgi:hypothetical protein